MARPKTNPSQSPPKKIRRSITPESRQNQMIALAVDLVESRLLDKTATSQETTHYLKMAASREKADLEIEKLRLENELIKAKMKALESHEDIKRLYTEAIAAMKKYSGHGDAND